MPSPRCASCCCTTPTIRWRRRWRSAEQRRCSVVSVRSVVCFWAGTKPREL
jgi:hypothetical protein